MVLSKKLGGLQPKEEIPSVSKKSKAGSQGFVSGFTFDQEMVGIVVYGCMIFGYIWLYDIWLYIYIYTYMTYMCSSRL